MKRDPRLHTLSSDHHQALVLARRIEGEVSRGEAGAATVVHLRNRFELELAPHFAAEERHLLPALREAGRAELVDRTLREHAALRGHLAGAEAGDLGRLDAFAKLLAEHVRFEEHELFPACEEVGGPALDALAAEARSKP
jgi:hemerythrin-like domain-containing protein